MVGSYLASDTTRTDIGHSTAFASANIDRLRFVEEWECWLIWDGVRWRNDGGIGALACAKEFALSLWPELGSLVKVLDRDEFGKAKTFVARANSAKGIDAFLRLAKADPRLVVSHSELDQKPTLLNLPNGTLDLDNGTLLPHNPSDLITQLASVEYDPGAKCPQWEETMRLVFDDNSDLIIYFQQLLGYSLFGGAPEAILAIWFGSGCNGKSTLWGVIHSLLGDYAIGATQDLIMPLKGQHPTEKADLFARRFCMVAEPNEGRRLDEATVKTLTGGDVIKARRMKENYWEFSPTHTLHVATNHKPKISGTDTGIWRRVKLIPFTVDLSKVTTPRKGFSQWLVDNESSGILNWLLIGYQDWRKNGFREPEIVLNATAEYRESEDQISRFIAECCEVGPGCQARAGDLYSAFTREGYTLSATKFGKELSARFDWDKTRLGKVYFGVGLPA